MDVFQKIKQRFPYLQDDKLAQMLSMGELVVLNAGDVFTKRGEWSHRIGLVIEGMLRNYIVDDEGEQVTVVFATEMQAIATYATIFLNKPANETTEALEPSVLFVMDYNEVKSLIDSDPALNRIYIDLMEATLVSAILRIEDFTQRNPEQRYQRLLDMHGFLIERAPLKHLASYLGITPVSLSRIRKRLMPKRNYLL